MFDLKESEHKKSCEPEICLMVLIEYFRMKNRNKGEQRETKNSKKKTLHSL